MNTSTSTKPVAFITGGAGGLGEATARLLASDYQVVVSDLDLDACEKVAREIGGVGIVCDVNSAASVAACIAKIESTVGPVDAMAHFAGIIQERRYTPEEFDQDRWDQIFGVNARGTWIVCREVGARMAQRHRGSIVTIASVAGHRSWPTHAYAASKAAVLSITKNLASEWGRSGVRVNSVTPGFTMTPHMRKLQAAKGWTTDRISKQTPLGRWLEPHEIAEGVAFLLSAKASAITGIDLAIDGGWLAGINWGSHSGLPGSR